MLLIQITFRRKISSQVIIVVPKQKLTSEHITLGAKCKNDKYLPNIDGKEWLQEIDKY
jgi:hypothetical protein